MLAKISWLRLSQTFQKVQIVSRQKKINSFGLANKDQTQTSSLHKRLEARLAGGHRKALAT